MCNFFSFTRDEFGKNYYFDWNQRVKMEHVGVDSHDHIISFYKLDPDKVNCFEYNPLTGVFTVDKINTIDNSVLAEEWVRTVDFKRIVEPLIIKEIVNPLTGKPKKVTKRHKDLLKKWDSVRASVWASVRDSVWDSVWASVRDSVRASVWDSVGASVRASVGASVRASVGASVWDSVGASVRDSVRASVWAYISTFFDIEYKIDLSPAIELWNAGLIPSFDSKTWRLHSGEKAEIVYEWNK